MDAVQQGFPLLTIGPGAATSERVTQRVEREAAVTELVAASVLCLGLEVAPVLGAVVTAPGVKAHLPRLRGEDGSLGAGAD